MLYLDSNIFIIAAISNEQKAAKAKELLKKIILGEIKAGTSCLTIDEVTWILLKETKEREQSIQHALKILEFDNLEFIKVDNIVIKKALSLMKYHNKLNPRDAIHLASALIMGASVIVSEDSDFDNIKELKRKSLEQFK